MRPVSSPATSELARGQSPRRTAASWAATRRITARINASAWSATLVEFAPGVVVTATPAAVAALTSIASKPTPTRATIASAGHASKTTASKASVLAITPIASPTAAATCAAVRSPTRGDISYATPASSRRSAPALPGKPGQVTTTGVLDAAPAMRPSSHAVGG